MAEKLNNSKVHKNCQNCLLYDKFVDMQLMPCDDEDALRRHYCLSYKKGIPDKVWSGKERCPDYLEDDES